MYIFKSNTGVYLCVFLAALSFNSVAENKVTHSRLNSQDSSNHVAVYEQSSHTTQRDEHNEAEHFTIQEKTEHADGGINLTSEKMSLANITVESITPDVYFSAIYAPGEVQVNGYTSYVVSPRTESVIIKRHAILGEHVRKNQDLVTLFSETMASAQADYLIASTQWQRIKRLGNKTISESQLLNSETTFNAAYGRLIALGLTDDAIKLISKNNTTLFGQYTLTAQRAGIVLSDAFSQGQRVAAGDEIMLLADEDELWVEARIAASKKVNLLLNTPVTITFGGRSYEAKVIQEAHTIDPITRTRIIRLSVKNSDDSLHSGMFVNVNFKLSTITQVLAVPEEALIRSADGDWVVFVEDYSDEEISELEPVEVELGRSFGEYREVIGLASGSRVVTKGAFFVASEIAKGGFDPHNH